MIQGKIRLTKSLKTGLNVVIMILSSLPMDKYVITDTDDTFQSPQGTTDFVLEILSDRVNSKVQAFISK